MTLSLKEAPEPLSPLALDERYLDELAESGRPLNFMRSDEYNTIRREIQKFIDGTIHGRSILLAGHRGSGKTLLVKLVVQDVLQEARSRRAQSAKRSWGYHPLYVPLHGPSMFNAQLWTSLDDQGRPIDGELTHAIKHIVRSIYHAVADQIEQSLRQRFGTEQESAELAEQLELVSHLRLQMDDGIGVSELRRIWRRLDSLSRGVLLEKSGPWEGKPLPSGRGSREILALTYATWAYRIVSTRGLSDTTTQTLTSKLSLKIEQELVEKLLRKGEEESGKADSARAVTAGVVGSGTAVAAATSLFAGSAGPLEAGLVALLVALLSLLTTFGASFALSNTWTRKRETTHDDERKISFQHDRTPATLRDMLPILLNRLRAIGLAPILVVDELDKVDISFTHGPFKMFMDLAKSINQEHATFLFLADRELFHRHQRELSVNPATTASSWFNHVIYLTYSPRELRNFAQSLIKTTR